VTHAFRKLFNNDEFQLSIGVDGMPSLPFSSLRLVLYTKTGKFASQRSKQRSQKRFIDTLDILVQAIAKIHLDGRAAVGAG
jgi:hypothetical protein